MSPDLSRTCAWSILLMVRSVWPGMNLRVMVEARLLPT